MGFGASASRDRSSGDMFQNQTQNRNTNTTGTSNTNSVLNSLRNIFSSNNQQQQQQQTATFAPGGAATLTALGGTAGAGGANMDRAAAGFGDFNGQVSPYTEDIIKSGNMEADKQFANRLATTRAGAYRGGTAANIGKQGQLAADFTNQQQGENARLRQGAYDNAQTNKLAATAGLSGLGTEQQGLGAQLLQLLRGGTTTGTTTGTSTGQETGQDTGQQQTTTAQQTIEQLVSALTGHTSGTQSNTGGGFSVLKGRG